MKEAKHLCDSCAAAHHVTPATHELKWDLGSMYLCDKCYPEYVRK